MIDLKLLKKEFLSCIGENYGLEPQEVTNEKDYLYIEIALGLPYCDDDILLSINVFSDGREIIDYMFDKINISLKVMKYINELNNSLDYIKAYIDENNYFHLQSSISCNDSINSLINNFQDSMDTIIWDRAQNFIKPITDLTYIDIEV